MPPQRCPADGHGFAELLHPDLRSGLLVERVDFVFLGRDDQEAGVRSGLSPEKRLRMRLAAIGRVERRVEAQSPRALVGQLRHDVMAGASERAFVGQDGRIGAAAPEAASVAASAAASHGMRMMSPGERRRNDGPPLHYLRHAPKGKERLKGRRVAKARPCQ